MKQKDVINYYKLQTWTQNNYPIVSWVSNYDYTGFIYGQAPGEK